MSNTEAWFGGFGTAQPRRQGGRIGGGRYRLRVTGVVRRVSSKPKTRGHIYVILEAEVVEVLASLPPEDGYDPSCIQGQAVSDLNNLTQNGETAESNVMGWLQAIAARRAAEQGQPFSADDYGPDDWRRLLIALCDPETQPAVGAELICDATRGQLTDGRLFTFTSYTAAPVAPVE